jgi:caa(3)-type oxidase subunit IV
MSASKTKVVAGIEFNVQYMVIWVVLLVLTLIEVFIPEMSGHHKMLGIQMPRSVGVLVLISLAIIKTYCVAWFYMHLVDERPLIVLIASAPFIFSVFLTVGLFPW